jgi:hypothetical protein
MFTNSTWQNGWAISTQLLQGHSPKCQQLYVLDVSLLVMAYLTLLQEVDDLKRGLDNLLREWKPPRFKSMDQGMDPVRVC